MEHRSVQSHQTKEPHDCCEVSQESSHVENKSPEKKITENGNPEKASAYAPLFIVLAYVIGAVLFRSFLSADYRLHTLMNNFMGGFFLIFSLFKLIDVRKFADAFQSYDLLAARSRAYALAYPFLEIVFAVNYFGGYVPLLTNAICAIVMLFGAIGISRALSASRTIQCACLGAVFELPMTKVSLFENILMGGMAILMMFQHGNPL